MKNTDAAAILDISGEITPESVKVAFRKACAKYHPDRNPAGLEMMKSVNLAYDCLKDFTGSLAKEDIAENYGELINAALNAIIHLNLEIEICGSWVWVSGDTKPVKDILYGADFHWAPVKEKWFFRPANFKSSSRGKYSMEEIREKHGSVKVKAGRAQLRIAAR